jgi:hypothetical protein
VARRQGPDLSRTDPTGSAISRQRVLAGLRSGIWPAKDYETRARLGLRGCFQQFGGPIATSQGRRPAPGSGTHGSTATEKTAADDGRQVAAQAGGEAAQLGQVIGLHGFEPGGQFRAAGP